MGGRKVAVGLRNATILLIAEAPSNSKSPRSLPKGSLAGRYRLEQVQRTVRASASGCTGRPERSARESQISVPSSSDSPGRAPRGVPEHLLLFLQPGVPVREERLVVLHSWVCAFELTTSSTEKISSALLRRTSGITGYS